MHDLLCEVVDHEREEEEDDADHEQRVEVDAALGHFAHLLGDNSGHGVNRFEEGGNALQEIRDLDPTARAEEHDHGFTDDTAKRFESYHWHVIPNVDGYNPDAIAAAIKAAQAQTTRPTLIVCKTIIGYGAPDKQGTKAAHGEALGAEEIAKARKQLNWSYEPFVIPDELKAQWDHRQSGQAAEKIWQDLFARYQKEYPELAAEFERRTSG